MVLGIIAKIAEERIKQATERGEMDNLPGKGKPMIIEDDSRVPDDLRMAFKVLKNAGFTPPEIEARAELVQVEDLLANATDEKTRYKALKRLNYLTMKLGELRPGSSVLDEHSYAERIVDRLSKRKSGDK